MKFVPLCNIIKLKNCADHTATHEISLTTVGETIGLPSDDLHTLYIDKR